MVKVCDIHMLMCVILIPYDQQLVVCMPLFLDRSLGKFLSHETWFWFGMHIDFLGIGSRMRFNAKMDWSSAVS